MKNVLLIISIILFFKSLYSQESCTDVIIDFESSMDYVKFDSVSQLWQIGRANKTIFDRSYSGQNVIVTDTVDSYSSSTKSFFQIKSKNDRVDNQTKLSFYHRYHTDTLADFGYVMFSLDGGANWSLCQDTSFLYDPSCGSYAEVWQFRQYLEPPYRSTNQVEPIFTGSELSWVKEEYQFSWWYGVKKGGGFDDPDPCSADSILFRFYFESDSIESSKDGWMIDNIEVRWDFSGDINEDVDNHIGIYPIPFKEYLNVNNTIFDKIEIVDIAGKVLISVDVDINSKVILNTDKLESGLYLMRFSSSNMGFITKRIFKN